MATPPARLLEEDLLATAERTSDRSRLDLEAECDLPSCGCDDPGVEGDPEIVRARGGVSRLLRDLELPIPLLMTPGWPGVPSLMMTELEWTAVPAAAAAVC